MALNQKWQGAHVSAHGGLSCSLRYDSEGTISTEDGKQPCRLTVEYKQGLQHLVTELLQNLEKKLSGLWLTKIS